MLRILYLPNTTCSPFLCFGKSAPIHIRLRLSNCWQHYLSACSLERHCFSDSRSWSLWHLFAIRDWWTAKIQSRTSCYRTGWFLKLGQSFLHWQLSVRQIFCLSFSRTSLWSIQSTYLVNIFYLCLMILFLDKFFLLELFSNCYMRANIEPWKIYT